MLLNQLADLGGDFFSVDSMCQGLSFAVSQ